MTAAERATIEFVLTYNGSEGDRTTFEAVKQKAGLNGDPSILVRAISEINELKIGSFPDSFKILI
jgi:hypothetical protein